MHNYTLEGRWRIWRNGAPSDLLPEVISSKVQVLRSGPGGFEVVLPIDGVNVAELVDDLWIALGYEVLALDGTWIEPPSCRFIPLVRRINYDDSTLTISGASLGWIFGKVVRWPDPFRENSDGKIEFNDASAGTILQWHYYFGFVRRAIQNVTIDFDASADSDGVLWADRYDVDYERGVTFRQILDGFVADGIVWRTYGDTLQVAQGTFADTPTEIPVLRGGIEVSPSVVEASLDNAVGTALLTAGPGLYAAATATNFGEWGRWEVSVSQQGVKGASTLDRLARAELARHGAVESTATVQLLPNAEWRAFDNVRVGSVVTVQYTFDEGRVWRWDRSRWDSDEPFGSGGTWSTEITGAIEEMVITDDGTETEVALTVGDRRRSAEELFAETTLGLTGGRVTRRPITGRTS